MADDNKCAHDLCQCARRENSKYCSQFCEEADAQDLTEIKCGCGHTGCAENPKGFIQG